MSTLDSSFPGSIENPLQSDPLPAAITKQRLHAIVHGRVQGVSYRFFTKQMADTLDVTGYIYNQPDGTVEVVAEGVPQELERLLTFLYEGSPAAQVERVDFEYTQPTGEYLAFTIRFILLD